MYKCGHLKEKSVSRAVHDSTCVISHDGITYEFVNENL